MKFGVISADTLLRIAPNGELVLSNPRCRTHIELVGCDRTCFSNADGNMADPTGYGPAGEMLSGAKLYDALCKNQIIDNDYAEYLKPKTSLLDNQHLGSFHQKLGQHQLLTRRKDKWRWWHDQKFAPDGLSVRSGLYKSVQEAFFNSYFTERVRGKTVLDFGCGNGFYTARFSAFGASAVGVDTSEELIAIARKNFPAIEFINSKDSIKSLESWKPGIFDAIYLSDVLLFFFHDLEANSKDLKRLLKALHRLLKVDGKLFLMEPNGIFWLAPWLGDEQHPWTIVNEYREHLYQVAPTPDKVVQALTQNGFVITDYQHPIYQGDEQTMEASFARAFPIWDFWVAEKQ